MTLADSIFSVGWDLKISYDSILAGGEKFAYSVNGTCFDTGKTTAAVLRRFERYTDARTSGDPSERSSGNGSMIRLTPVPIRYRDLFRVDLRCLSSLAVETSLPTPGQIGPTCSLGTPSPPDCPPPNCLLKCTRAT